MVHAFVMVQTGPGQSPDLLERVRALSAVADAHVVAGEYDLVVELTGEAVYDLLHVASTELQDLEGVSATKTYISLS